MTASERAALRQGGWLPDLGATLVPQQVSVGPGKVEGEGGVGWGGCGRRARPVLSRPGLGGTGNPLAFGVPAWHEEPPPLLPSLPEAPPWASGSSPSPRSGA